MTSTLLSGPRGPWVRGLLCLLGCYAAAALGGLASVDAPTFYAALTRPTWAPPAWVFGPVWSVLYTLMAITLWRLWRAGSAARVALWLFGAQLAVNALWSWTFFAWRLGAVAMATVLLLLVLVAATRWQARRHDRLAAALLFPYLLWVGFASVLTATLWRLNPGLLG